MQIACPRLSYLPYLLPKLLDFFAPQLISDAASVSAESGYFSFEAVPLKWHLPIGLLYDIYVLSTSQTDVGRPAQQSLPFQLTLHFSPSSATDGLNLINPVPTVVNDAFINSVKEADFLRSGTAKPIMSLSAADSKALWSSTQENDLNAFARIYNALLPPPGQLRNIPLRVYLPSSGTADDPGKAQIKVLQAQFSPNVIPIASVTMSQLRGISPGQPQTLGVALHSLIPSLFPSRRTPILAKPILHGAPVPMNANLEDLTRKCCYADGWINVVIVMTS